MAKQEQLEILKQGVEVWNKWREDNPDVEVDLTRAYLRSANLKRANLTGVNLQEADLRFADLSKAHFFAANLAGADLSYTNLRLAHFTLTNLTEAYINEADLYGTNFVKSNLKNANAVKALFGGTLLRNIDLSELTGLEKAIHTEPSTIDISTIRLSKGKIPVEFLRGCGLTDLEIEQAKLATPGLDPDQVTQITYEIHRLYCDQPIQFYSCFISYNNKDHGFAKRLHDDLQENGVRCWLATEDMKIGDPIRPTIDREIRLRDKLLVILSEAAIHSEWVGDEVEAAIEEESASDRLVLFPIRLDNAVINTRDDWAAKIKRRRHIGDFSNWQNERSYRQAFERLLRDLEAQ